MKTVRPTALAASAGSDPPLHGCLALIAIKRRVQCKSRLSGVIELGQRLALVRNMLGAVIDQCRHATLVGQIVVLSPERDEVPADIPVLADNGDDLNIALAQAHRSLRGLGVHEWLVLPADLPAVTATEIDAVIAAGRASGCALACDTTGSGTNALYLRLHADFDYCFGERSRALHLKAARQRGISAQVLELPGLAQDVDTLEDLFRLDERTWQRQPA